MEDDDKISTRARLHSILDDIEIVCKELLECIGTSRQARQDDIDPTQLVVLLKQKDAEFQNYMRIAKEQGEIQKEMNELESNIEKRDVQIKFIQKNVKEAAEILTGSLYEGKQKLKAISQANSRKISSEELIKYAHKISAGNSVASPSDWHLGDLRRPYPTELDMRQSSLHSEYNKLGSQYGADARQLPGQYTGMGAGPSAAVLTGHSIPWQPSVEVQSTLLNRLPPSAETTPNSARISRDYSQHTPLQQQQHKEEVELMSSDSSSSSSSDE